MNAFQTTGNLFADFLFFSVGTETYSFHREEYANAFIDFFCMPFLFCDGMDQMQLVEIKSPVFCSLSWGSMQFWGYRDTTIPTGGFFLHPGHLLKRARAEKKSIYSGFLWDDLEAKKAIQCFTITINTIDSIYCFKLIMIADSNGIEKTESSWERKQ